MTSRERLQRLFEGREIDRVPVWLLFPYFPSPSYANIWEEPSYKPILKKVYAHTDTIERRSYHSGFCLSDHPDIVVTSETEGEADDPVTRVRVRYADIELTKVSKRGGVIKPFVEDAGQLDLLLSLPYLPVKPDFTQSHRDREAFGDHGLYGVSMADPVSILHGLCSETGFVLLCATETEKVVAFLDVMHERLMAFCRYALENSPSEIYWFDGPELVLPPMLSPDYFEPLIVRYWKSLMEMIHDHGRHTMMHVHGSIKAVLPGIADIAPQSIHPVEAPPMGDTTLTEAREILGDEIILAGNIQFGDLYDKSEEEMDQIVRNTIEEGRNGPFILATTGGPSSQTIPPQVAKNYHRIIDTALEIGRY
jgi:uroporphyrinogen-III decarboxylase